MQAKGDGNGEDYDMSTTEIVDFATVAILSIICGALLVATIENLWFKDK